MCHITVLQWVFQQDHKRFQSLRKMWFTMSHLWIFQKKTFSERMMRPWWSPSPGRDCNQMIIFPPVKLGDVLEQAFYCTPSYFPLFCALYFIFRALLCFVFRISRSSVLCISYFALFCASLWPDPWPLHEAWVLFWGSQLFWSDTP